MSAGIPLRPNGITVDRTAGVLRVIWNTGETHEFPLSHLREACPCVECRGGHAFMGLAFAPDNLLTLTPRRGYSITAVHPVGLYAICPQWDDGHATGIYSWDYLYHIAPKP